MSFSGDIRWAYTKITLEAILPPLSQSTHFRAAIRLLTPYSLKFNGAADGLLIRRVIRGLSSTVAEYVSFSPPSTVSSVYTDAIVVLLTLQLLFTC